MRRSAGTARRRSSVTNQANISGDRIVKRGSVVGNRSGSFALRAGNSSSQSAVGSKWESTSMTGMALPRVAFNYGTSSNITLLQPSGEAGEVDLPGRHGRVEA